MAKDETHIRTERLPSVPVSTPAAQRGLDDRGDVLPAKQGSTRRKSRNLGTARGARSTLIDPTGNVLSNGFGHGVRPYVKD